MTTTTTITAEAENRDHLPTGDQFAEVVNDHLLNSLISGYDFRLALMATGWSGTVRFEPSPFGEPGSYAAALELSQYYPNASFTWTEIWDADDDEDAGARTIVFRAGLIEEQRQMTAVLPGEDPATGHIEAICAQADLPVMVQLYSDLRKRGALTDDQILRLSAAHVTATYRTLFETRIGEGLNELAEQFAPQTHPSHTGDEPTT